MRPNDEEVTLVLGLLNRGVLKALKNSAQNWVCSFSVMWNCLNIDRSQFLVTLERMSGEKTEWLPNVNGDGWLKTPVLKYSPSRSCTRPVSFPLWPLLLGTVM